MAKRARSQKAPRRKGSAKSGRKPASQTAPGDLLPSEFPNPSSDSDRRLRQAARHARTLKVLQRIMAKGRCGPKDLAAELECSERTIHRVLEVLELAGVPWYFDERERSCRVRPDFRFPTLRLDDEELLGQAVSTAIAEAPGLKIGLGAKPTTRKLADAAGERAEKMLREAADLVSVLSLQIADHDRAQGVIQTAQWALLRRRQLVGNYQSPYQPRPVRLRLHPYRLPLVKQAWYLIARPDGEDAPKTYRIARFQSLRMVDDAAVVPEKFDLRDYFGDAWAVYRGQTTYDVEIAFTKDAATLVAETIWHHSQRVERRGDGTAVLRFRVAGLDEIVHWVLGWSGRAKVIAPPELREKVVEHLQAALKLQEI
ncbi:MAG TPA: WYL domain-containing transcriptional regulator [Pirellulales bacterium]|nr:WYL domain-containing transcriptional regulator [Pirellulales bacterium]